MPSADVKSFFYYRNKILASEIKMLKQQVQTLLKKGQNDDELIQALMVSLK